MANNKEMDIKGLSDTDLANEIASQESAYTSMKFEHAARGLANPLELRELRRTIARLKTELRSREMAQYTPEQLAQRTRIRARRRKA